MRHLTSILMGLLFPLSLLAQGWESEYAKIENSIRKVQFPDKSFVITKYGASPDATAAKNQEAINKAISRSHQVAGVVKPSRDRLQRKITVPPSFICPYPLVAQNDF